MYNILYIAGCKEGSEVIYTKNDQLHKEIISMHPSKIIEKIMVCYYRTLKGNTQLIGKHFDFHQKVPVFIDYHRHLFFPTISKDDKECCWINYYCVFDVKGRKRSTNIVFYEHSIINRKKKILMEKEFPYDARVIRKQMNRCKEIHANYDKKLVI